MAFLDLRRKCSPRRKAIAFFLLLFFLLPFQSFAGTFTAFGPKSFTRSSGSPVAVIENFSVLNPNTTYTIRIHNGGLEDDELELVSSSIFILNGTQIVGPSEFNQNVALIEKTITLASTNELSVELRGKPGGGLTVEIIGIADDLPTITATASPLPNPAGWNNTDVTVTFVCTDDGSGISICPDPIVVNAEGANQVISGTAVNNAGNSASASVTINLDKTAPNLASALNPLPNPAGWNNSDTTISFSATDALSGVETVSSPTTITTEGAGQSVSGTATDLAGNTATSSATVNLDKTAPNITAASAPLPNANGWNNSDVTVSFTATDLLSGIDTVSGPEAVITEGANQSIIGTATDIAGNSANTSISISLDKTSPTVIATAAPLPNTAGWNNSDVNVTFNATDTLSGIDTVSPVTTLTTEGSAQVVTGNATDIAGNTANASIIINVDKTPPDLTSSVSPAPNPAGWNNSNLTVSFSAIDSLSGVASFSSPVAVVTEGSNQPVTGTATDLAGNTVNDTISINLDKSPPNLDLSLTPSPNAAGWNNTDTTVSFTASDDLSGLISVPGSFTVSTEGANQAVGGTVTDIAGNSTTVNGSVSLDKTSPNVTSTSPADGSTFPIPGITTTGDATDFLSGVSSVTCNNFPASLSGSTYSCDLVLVNGDNPIQVVATDTAGNQGTTSIIVAFEDTTTLTITVSVNPLPNTAGWHNQDVTVSFVCNDPENEVATCPDPIVVSTEGVNQTISGIATNVVGDTATTSITLNIDKTPPTLNSLISPPPNAAGWNNADTTVTFTATDTISGVDTVSSPETITVEGAGQTISGTAADIAGNTTNASITINIDKTAPTITGSGFPAPNLQGWNNTGVGITFDATDTLSGIDTVAPPPGAILSTEGANQIVNGTATDLAGNSASTTLSFSIDKTAPLITPAFSPLPNPNGWNNSDTTVSFTATDVLSGVADVTAPSTISTEGSNQFILGNSTDNAGNVATASATLNLDKTPPVVSITSPSDNFLSSLLSVDVNGTVTENTILSTLTVNGIDTELSDGGFDTFIDFLEGAQSITVQAEDIAGNSGSSSVNGLVNLPPLVTITSPSDLSSFSLSPITVTGTTDDPLATVVVVDASGNSVPAPVTEGIFSADILLREGANNITAVSTDALGTSGTDRISVVLDQAAPQLTIEYPSEGLVVHSSPIHVSGTINDLVVGTVNSEQVEVTVNGVPASVANRTFLAEGVPLSVGLNTITATGTDQVGNVVSASVTVSLEALVGNKINLVSGNNQSGFIQQTLADPLIVSLTDSIGNPVSNEPVIFRVIQNNGHLSNGSGTNARALIVATDVLGQAQATFTLGSRTGAGNNQVKASAVGFQGEILFAASATFNPPAKINLDAGNNQRAAVSQPLPKPFIAIVTDEGHNRLPNIPVTFSVIEGGGDINGQRSFTINTDSDGRALSVLTLGPNPGFDNNIVEASFPGLTGSPSIFVATAMVPGDPTLTKVSGVVLDNSNNPIEGVTMQIEGTALTTQTDAEGQFEILGAPVGHVLLIADGNTALRPGVWPTLEYEIVTVAGQNNTIGMPIYLLPIDVPNGLFVDGTTGGTLTMPEFPGFSLEIAPGSATFPDGSQSGTVSATIVHSDKVPMTPNFGQQPRIIVTIQPSGVVFDPPAAITFPNVDGLAPGTITELYSFDHDVGQFVGIGTGTVSEDGLLLQSDPGVGIVKGGWQCGGDPTELNAAGESLTIESISGPSEASVGIPSDVFTATANAPGILWTVSGPGNVSGLPSGRTSGSSSSINLTFDAPGTYTLTATCGSVGRSVSVVVGKGVVFPITLMAFIPYDNVPDPRGFETVFGGDGDGTVRDKDTASFRARQEVTVISNEEVDADGEVEGTKQESILGETRLYHRATSLDSFDKLTDAAKNDRVKDETQMIDFAPAIANEMEVNVLRLSMRKVEISLKGRITNGLLPLAPDSFWDFTLIIDQTAPLNPQYEITGEHDGFPAFEIYIGDQRIFLDDAKDAGSCNSISCPAINNLFDFIGDENVNERGSIDQ